MTETRVELMKALWNQPVRGQLLQFRDIGGVLKHTGKREPCTLPQLLQILGATKLGSGAYGTASKVSVGNYAFVVKESRYIEQDIRHPEAVNNPHLTNNVEARVLGWLNDYVLLEQRTPHLPLYAGFFHCDARASYLLIEYADGALEKLFKGNKAWLIRNIKNVVFQIIWTLAAIHEVFPDFRHNDLHIGNILYVNSSTTGANVYRTPERTFYLPNIGRTMMLSDFGLTNISGQLANYAVTGLEYDNTGMGTTTNRYADGFRILNYLATVVWGHPEFNAFFNRHFRRPPELVDSRYLTIRNDIEYTTMRALLSDPFFAEFTQPRADVQAVYDIRGRGHLTSPRLYVEPLDVRKSCPSYELPYVVNKRTIRQRACANTQALTNVVLPKDLELRIWGAWLERRLGSIPESLARQVFEQSQQLFLKIIPYLHLPRDWLEFFHVYVLQWAWYKLVGRFLFNTRVFLLLISPRVSSKTLAQFNDLITQLNTVVYELGLHRQELIPEYEYWETV